MRTKQDCLSHSERLASLLRQCCNLHIDFLTTLMPASMRSALSKVVGSLAKSIFGTQVPVQFFSINFNVRLWRLTSIRIELSGMGCGSRCSIRSPEHCSCLDWVMRRCRSFCHGVITDCFRWWLGGGARCSWAVC